jgi:hypothetical protein
MKLMYFGPKSRLAIVVLLAIVSAHGVTSAQQPSESPLELVRRTVQREVTASNGNTKVMFLDRKETPHGSQTKMIVETREGMAGILVAVNDKQLTGDQRQAEEDHLTRLVNNPEELAKKQKSEKEDAERITRIIKALPDALLFEPDGTEVGTQEMGKAGEELVRLRVHPNPKYSPPTHVEQVLTGMQGYILIDAEQHRIAKIDGTLAKDVGFGWGFLGHLNKGGHFLVTQAEIMKGDWEVTHMGLSFTGKVLMFKSLNIKSDEVFSNFRPVPSNLTFAQGIELLKKQEAELADNQQQPGADSHK